MKTSATTSVTWTRCHLYSSSTKTQAEKRCGTTRVLGTPRINSRCRRLHSDRSIILRTTTEVDAPVEQEKIKESFDWFKHWWPVQFTYNLDDDRPNRIELLGEFFAVWKSKSGEWIAMKDMCPHRLAPLSEGRVEEDGTLMCSYHGWRFNECGKCVKIPQADDERSHEVACSNQRSVAKTFPCKARGSILWIWPDSTENAFDEAMASSIPLPDDIADYLERISSEGDRTGFIRTVPYDYETLAENLLDPAHLPFSHHGVGPVWKRSNGGAIKMVPASPMTKNAIASVTYTNSNSSFQGKSCLEFVDPALVMYTTSSPDPEKSNRALLLLLSPVKDGQSRIFIHNISEGGLSGHKLKMSIRSKLLFSTPAMSHLARNNILDGDNVFLHFQDQILRREKKNGWTPDTYFTPTSSDYMVNFFRNWLRKEGGGGPFGPLKNQETSPITRRELLDRYETYTLQNKEAQKMLAFVNRSIVTLKTLSNVFLLMGGAFVLYSIQKGIGFLWQTVLCLCAFALCSFLKHFARKKILPLFYFVDYVHADN